MISKLAGLLGLTGVVMCMVDMYIQFYLTQGCISIGYDVSFSGFWWLGFVLVFSALVLNSLVLIQGGDSD